MVGKKTRTNIRVMNIDVRVLLCILSKYLHNTKKKLSKYSISNLFPIVQALLGLGFDVHQYLFIFTT